MNHSVNFYLANYTHNNPVEWFNYFSNDIINKKNQTHFLFGHESIVNLAFPRVLLNSQVFLHIAKFDSKNFSLEFISNIVKMSCEKMLVLGRNSEIDVNITFADNKNFVLREYNDIKFEKFDYNYLNKIEHEHRIYKKMNEYHRNLPVSMSYLMYFVENNQDDVLILDNKFFDYYPALSKYFMPDRTFQENKKYKAIYHNAKEHQNIPFSLLYNSLKPNGVILTWGQQFNISYGTSGWFDLSAAITAFIKNKD